MNEKKEYIERGALIDSFENCYWLYNSTDRETVRQALENAPAADVAPVVHGEWIEQVKVARKNNLTPLYYYKCSLCGVYLAKQANYCPNCGAKMDGGKHETD